MSERATSDESTRTWTQRIAVDRAPSTPTGCSPAIIQQWDTGEVLMLGWMDAEALRRTLTEGRVTFWSRSRQEYWRKGDTSGHIQYVRGAAPRLRRRRAARHGRAGRPRLPHRHAHLLRRRPAPGRRGIRARRLTTPNDDEEIRVPSATTSFEEFTALLPGRRVVPVIRELFADGETPVGIYRKLAAGRPGTFLLESAEQGGIWSRYSFVGASSFGVLTERDGRVEWQDYGLSAERALGDAGDLAPLAALEALFERWRTEDVAGRAAPHRRARRVHRVGGHPPDRAPAEPAAAPTSGCRDRPSRFVSELVVHRPPHGHRAARSRRPCTTATTSPEALWVDAQERLDRMQRRLARPSEAWLAEIDLATAAAPTHAHREGRLPRGRRAVEGVHPRRRHLPGRDLAALRAGGHGRPDRRVPRAAQPEPEPVHVPAAPRRPGRRALLDRRIVARGARQGAGRARLHPPDRRVEAPRRDARAGRRPRGRAARRPQGAGRAPHARRPRPQRPREGLHGRAPSR